MTKAKEIPSGTRFGSLVIYSKSAKTGCHVFWDCVCDCGNKVTVSGGNLRAGITKTCGDRTKHKVKSPNYKHGDRARSSPYYHLYKTWAGIIQRCTNSNSTSYPYYGGKGISVCEDWKDYRGYKKWALSNGYEPGLSIDRIDLNKGYCPDNCRWVTQIQQANNKSNNVYLNYNGEKHTIAEWARILNIPATALYQRKETLHWDDQKILTTPYRKDARSKI